MCKIDIEDFIKLLLVETKRDEGLSLEERVNSTLRCFNYHLVDGKIVPYYRRERTIEEWINVKEMLPPKNERVLVYLPAYPEDVVLFPDEKGDGPVVAFGQHDGEMWWLSEPRVPIHNVTHWAEIPIHVMSKKYIMIPLRP